jgi:glutamate 5-kinase
MNPQRQQYLSSVRTAVIKLGTQLLSDKEGRLDSALIGRIAAQVAELRGRGIVIAVVSSGAIGAGLRELNLPKRPTDLAKLQAVAAVGQRRLMDTWASAFEPHKLPVAQILLTREDVDDRTRFLNLRNTIAAIHDFGGVPIINENDTISTDELVKISFGDNDLLAALVAHALRADLLVLLSVVDGILDADGKPVRLIEQVQAAKSLVRSEKSAAGKGGFTSKLEAARQVTEFGEVMLVADGRMDNLLVRLLEGEDLGTLFAPVGKKISSRSRWIGSARPAGAIVVDDGAVKAISQNNKSLLPAGIKRIEGTFTRGDVIAIESEDGALIARGLTNYSSEDTEKIRGKRTADVRMLLADAAYDEVVHRDNLVLAERHSSAGRDA